MNNLLCKYKFKELFRDNTTTPITVFSATVRNSVTNPILRHILGYIDDQQPHH